MRRHWRANPLAKVWLTRLRTLVLVGVSALAGCTAAVAGALDEGQANRVIVALERAGVGSEKEPDPSAEGRFRVLVPRDDAPHAIAALREEDLPAEATPGLLDAVGKGSLMPSPMAEHTQFVAGLAGELERTLSSIDGVLSARVHLSLPLGDTLSDAPRPRATASVLVKHRGAAPPIEANAIQRLVAGAAPALAPDDVAVVLVPRPIVAAARSDQSLARFGPIWATRGSISALRTLVGVCMALDFALFGTVLLLWTRSRRFKSVGKAPAPSEPDMARRST